MPAQGRPHALPIIVSTRAGHRAASRVEAMVRAGLPGVDPHFLYPATLPDLVDVVDGLVRQGLRRLAVAGGDGTIHRVVNALGDASVVLAPIPTGSGNDFCRGIGLTADPAVALRALAGGRTGQVDLLEVNGRRVCTVAGLGLVADTGVQVGRLLAATSPWRPLVRGLGAPAYLLAAAARLLFHPSVTSLARVAWQDPSGARRLAQGPMHGVFLANLPTLGAGLRLPVPGRADDGRFELAWLPKSSRATLIRSLSCLRSGKPVPPGALQVQSALTAEIEWTSGSPLLGDGEDLGRARRFHVRVLPAALQVPVI
jgi:diacylglycerol kinase (ATP)